MAGTVRLPGGVVPDPHAPARRTPARMIKPPSHSNSARSTESAQHFKSEAVPASFFNALRDSSVNSVTIHD